MFNRTQHAAFKAEQHPGASSCKQTDVDALLHKTVQSPQCSRPAGVELTHSCALPPLHRHPVRLGRRATTVRRRFMCGRRSKVANLGRPAGRTRGSTSTVLRELVPSPPTAGGTEASLPCPNGSGSRLWPANSPGPVGFPSRCLPLGFRHTRVRCRLSGAHCHSISTTRMSLISQAETLALSQSGVPIHKRQPITATL